MEYAITYGLRYFGTILTGPNEGKVLDGHRTELIDIQEEGPVGEAKAFARAQADLTGKFSGRIEVYSRQWKPRAPGRRRGCFEFTSLGERSNLESASLEK